MVRGGCLPPRVMLVSRSLQKSANLAGSRDLTNLVVAIPGASATPPMIAIRVSAKLKRYLKVERDSLGPILSEI